MVTSCNNYGVEKSPSRKISKIAHTIDENGTPKSEVSVRLYITEDGRNQGHWEHG